MFEHLLRLPVASLARPSYTGELCEHQTGFIMKVACDEVSVISLRWRVLRYPLRYLKV